MGGDQPNSNSKHKRKNNKLTYDMTANMGVLPFYSQDSLSNSSSTNSLTSLDITTPPLNPTTTNLSTEHGESSTMIKANNQQESSSSNASNASSASVAPPVTTATVTAALTNLTLSTPLPPVQDIFAAPSPSIPTSQQKSNIDTLKDLEIQLANYIYLEKGLSTDAQKSYYTRGAKFLKNASGLAARTGIYDMYDADAQYNLDLYLQYNQALDATKTNDSGSRGVLLTRIQDIYKSTSWTGNRFPSIMESLLQLYIKVLDSKASNDEAHNFVQAAKKMRECAKEILSQDTSDEEIKTFVKNGPSTPLLSVIEKEIAVYSVAYSTDKDKKPNRMDATLNFLMVRLQEQIPQKDPNKGTDLKSSKQASDIHLHEIMHYLHKSLEMFKAMHNVVGIPAEHDEFVKTIAQAQQHLESYRGREHAAALNQVRITCIKLCEDLTQMINRYKDKKHPFDPDMAKSYLQTVSSFAALEKTEQRLRGAADTIVANSSKPEAKSEEKKILKL